MGKITYDLIYKSYHYLNPNKEYQLCLRSQKILEIENLIVTKDAFECIDLTDNYIINLPLLPNLKRLKTILLSNNKITFIEKDFSKLCPSLENLILINNQISSYKEIDNISSCKTLVRLSLIDNIITNLNKYRQYIIYKIPSLRVLDFQKVKLKEKKLAIELFGNKTENEIEEILIGKIDKNKEYLKKVNILEKEISQRNRFVDEINNVSNLDELKKLEDILKSDKSEKNEKKILGNKRNIS